MNSIQKGITNKFTFTVTQVTKMFYFQNYYVLIISGRTIFRRLRLDAIQKKISEISTIL